MLIFVTSHELWTYKTPIWVRFFVQVSFLHFLPDLCIRQKSTEIGEFLSQQIHDRITFVRHGRQCEPVYVAT